MLFLSISYVINADFVLIFHFPIDVFFSAPWTAPVSSLTSKSEEKQLNALQTLT